MLDALEVGDKRLVSICFSGAFQGVRSVWWSIAAGGGACLLGGNEEQRAGKSSRQLAGFTWITITYLQEYCIWCATNCLYAMCTQRLHGWTHAIHMPYTMWSKRWRKGVEKRDIIEIPVKLCGAMGVEWYVQNPAYNCRYGLSCVGEAWEEKCGWVLHLDAAMPEPAWEETW